jgi:hypothetical protein
MFMRDASELLEGKSRKDKQAAHSHKATKEITLLKVSPHSHVKIILVPKVVAHTCDASTQEADAEGLYFGQPGIQNEIEASLGYVVRPYLKTTKNCA